MNLDPNNIPVHIGVIMDGNGRWAKTRFMPRGVGHEAGMKRMIHMAEHAKAVGVKYLTVYALSTENLARPKEEVEGLFALIRNYFLKEVNKIYAQNAAVRVIGDISVFPQDVRQALEEGMNNSPANADFTLIFALNYGSRDELARAFNLAIARGESVTEKDISSLLYTAEYPDPDLIIRTGKEKRLSNFLLYQAAYAELYFTDVLFPDFTDEELDKAIADYQGRQRRFGKV